ncbi:MAG: MerR family transcriptional regulator [Desulfobacca sp. 4484_104]|nr:MAG: MerR family transcriptional regulator [Desulfobacca sp. 4484_104]RLA90405.1 MAG: MerR family transcriptional regulator [Deltaproteobacteria bacterium]
MSRAKYQRRLTGGLYFINDVSRIVNLSQKRIREYEKEGFIKPIREENTNNRLYSEFEISQILKINDLIHHRGFTVASLKNLLVLAPCWNIFDCQMKEECPAYKLPWRPCYEVREYRGTAYNGTCERCAVYLNREQRKDKVLEKFESQK